MVDRGDTRDRIIEALKGVLIEGGSSAVTLEGVAAAAGVSKGGLLYHFPSKAALLRGLLDDLEADLAEQLGAVADQPAGVARFYLQASTPSTDEELALFRSMIAALRTRDGAEDDARMLRALFEQWARPLRAAVDDPVLAETIKLVGDGIYLGALLGLTPPDPKVRDAMIERLLTQLPPDV